MNETKEAREYTRAVAECAEEFQRLSEDALDARRKAEEAAERVYREEIRPNEEVLEREEAEADGIAEQAKEMARERFGLAIAKAKTP